MSIMLNEKYEKANPKMKTGWEGILFLPTEPISPFVTLGKINRPQEGVYVGSLWNQQLLQAAGLDRGQDGDGSKREKWLSEWAENLMYMHV